MSCALCLRKVELRQSHIIPEFLYSPLYDEKHRFHTMGTAGRKSRILQKGYREKLLCAKCETRLGKHERYASHIFNGTEPVQTSQSGRLVEVQGIDYRKFKLFALSVLWRASISTLEIFEKVELGPHEERIRQLLLDADPGEASQYGFFLSPLTMDEKDLVEIIAQPTKARISGHVCYRFVFGGLVWAFVVSSHEFDPTLSQAFLSESGRMLMLVSELEDVTFLVNSIREVAKNV